MILRTARLILRPFEPRDAEPFAAINADPRAMRHFPATLDRARSDALIARLEEKRAREGLAFGAVEDRATGAFLGMVGLGRPDFEAPFAPCVEIGWRLAPAVWGRGIATEAARAHLAHAFDPRGLGLSEVVSFAVAANAPSLAVMDRLGFAPHPLGDFDHPRLPEGHPQRRHVLRLLRACDFRAPE